jgi:hypothetical protein
MLRQVCVSAQDYLHLHKIEVKNTHLNWRGGKTAELHKRDNSTARLYRSLPWKYYNQHKLTKMDTRICAAQYKKQGRFKPYNDIK